MKRVSVAGMGYMGKTHLGVYLKLPGVEVAALFDSRPESLDITSLEAAAEAMEICCAEIRSAREGREVTL